MERLVPLCHSARMKTILLTAFAFCTPLLPAFADPMTGAEFEAYTLGKTLTFSANGTIYGAEEYLPGQQVRWAFDQDSCMDGYWFEQNDNICFNYEDGRPTQCWQFFLEQDKLRAVFQGASDTELYEAHKTDAPMSCLGPQVGV